ncbi:GntR family transcriptional regulator (plasmid) [Paroceanicella profunda]|uniref:GntR family transcriptional regulator n=1 Tax=Paroceanicella profunda TaxID=2579971 RepID=A0A5B8FJE1_9RHOB|nr:GntR family transcriptional regulator [Paroceanicella profunda]QDL94317.1 GntR family transcriptional regulator [Paroceanicella profunda]
MPTEDSDRAKRGGSAGRVHETLRREILALALRPGTPLDETQLSQRFGLSRSPVREALSRLLAERLVEMLPNRSTIVAPIDLAGFPRFVEALDLQQRFATRLAARHRSDADLDRLRACAARFDETVQGYQPLEMSQANYDFHIAVAEAGQNPWVTRQYGELLNEARRLLHLHFEFLLQVDRTQVLNNQHTDIIEAIAARDAEAADALAHAHTMHFQTRFLKALHHTPDAEFTIEFLAERSARRETGA